MFLYSCFHLLKRLVFQVFSLLLYLMMFLTKIFKIFSNGKLCQISRTRCSFIVFIAFVLLLLYCFPSFIGIPRFLLINDVSDNVHECTGEELLFLNRAGIAEKNLLAYHLPLNLGEVYFPPLVGNGYIGFLAHTDAALYVMGQRVMDRKLPLHPLVSFILLKEGEEAPSEEAFLVDVRNGLVQSVKCYQTGTDVRIVQRVYAHRTRPGVFVQEVLLRNPTSEAVNIHLKRENRKAWKHSTTNEQEVFVGKEQISYDLTDGVMQVATSPQFPFVNEHLADERPSETAYVAVARTRMNESIHLPPTSWRRLRFVTCIYYNLTASDRMNSSWKDEVDAMFRSIVSVASDELRQEHSSVWQKLWNTGFSISPSLVSGALNGEDINSTLYYIASHTRVPLHDVQHRLSSEEKHVMRMSMSYTENCYAGRFSTLQAPLLWSKVKSYKKLASVVLRWAITLEKHGCARLLKSGADGVMQAVVLSFGALRFTDSHLECGLRPDDLHRDMYFRHVIYGNQTYLNITIFVGINNKASLAVSLNRADKPYYACDAGCLDPPVKLMDTFQTLPVKLTKPFTAILYITSDARHMEELKHAIHVRHVEEAPAHGHHILVMHKHGHALGGLPVIFWIGVGLLILTFHAFLVKLVYNEFTKNKEYQRGSYDTSRRRFM